MAAKVICRDIRTRVYECDSYPTVEQIASRNEELIPETLTTFINILIRTRKLVDEDKTNKRKGVTIAHAIIASTLPRSFISPLSSAKAHTFTDVMALKFL